MDRLRQPSSLSRRARPLARAGLLLSALLSGCATSSAPRAVMPAERPNCAWRVCIESEDTEEGRRYIVINGEPVPATVRLSFLFLDNLATSVALPIERVVPAETRGVLIELDAIRPGRPRDARPAAFIDLGTSATRPDISFLYGAPFGGLAPRQIIQGFNGIDTHQASMRYSIDFAMPEHTPIIASREGVVLYIQDGFTEGGRDPSLLEKSNLVVVAHEDGSMATYGHLSPGLPVSVGDRVEEGDLLGFSGMTGFTGSPHLHFHVGVRLLGDPGRTIPIRLKDRSGDEFFPHDGLFVEPAAGRRRVVGESQNQRP